MSKRDETKNEIILKAFDLLNFWDEVRKALEHSDKVQIDVLTISKLIDALDQACAKLEAEDHDKSGFH